MHRGRVSGCARAARLLIGVAGGNGCKEEEREEERERKRERKREGKGEEERFRPRSPPQANFEAVLRSPQSSSGHAN